MSRQKRGDLHDSCKKKGLLHYLLSFKEDQEEKDIYHLGLGGGEENPVRKKGGEVEVAQ